MTRKATKQLELLDNPDPKRPIYIPNFGDTIETAALVFKLSPETIRRKVKLHRIFHQSAPNGTIRFELAALSMILSQHWQTLERWRAGELDHPDVIEHYQHVEKLVAAWLETAREDEKKARLAAE